MFWFIFSLMKLYYSVWQLIYYILNCIRLNYEIYSDSLKSRKNAVPVEIPERPHHFQDQKRTPDLYRRQFRYILRGVKGEL